MLTDSLSNEIHSLAHHWTRGVHKQSSQIRVDLYFAPINAFILFGGETYSHLSSVSERLKLNIRERES